MNQRAQVGLSAFALAMSALALVVAFRSSPAPWRALAEARSVELAFRVDQINDLRAQFQDYIEASAETNRAEFGDAFTLLQNLGGAVEMEEGDARDAAIAAALSETKTKIREWTQ